MEGLENEWNWGSCCKIPKELIENYFLKKHVQRELDQSSTDAISLKEKTPKRAVSTDH